MKDATEVLPLVPVTAHCGLCLEPEGGGKGQHLARVFDNHDRNVAGQNVGSNRRAVAICQDRARLHAQSILDELSPVHLNTRQCRKEMPRLHVATVDGQAGDPHL